MIDKNILITMQKYLNHVCLFSAGNSWLITSRNWLKRCLSHTDLSCWPIRCGTSRSWCLRQVCSSTLVKCGLFCPEHRSFSMQPTWICKRRSRLATEHLSTSWKGKHHAIAVWHTTAWWSCCQTCTVQPTFAACELVTGSMSPDFFQNNVHLSMLLSGILTAFSCSSLLD